MELIQSLCYNLNGKQLSKICLWYVDEKYGTARFDPELCYDLSDIAADDDPEMLDDDER